MGNHFAKRECIGTANSRYTVASRRMRTTKQTRPFHSRMAATAAYLTHVAGGGIDYVRLLKLIYLSDRESLKLYGSPITYDDHLALQMGPVPDDTYQVFEHADDRPDWSEFLTIVGEKGHRLVLNVATKTLEDVASKFSPADLNVLDHVLKIHGKKSRTQLIDETHQLQEWKKIRNVNHGKKIHYEDIFLALGKNAADAKAMASGIRAFRHMHSVAYAS